ncbi:hypothetical protein L4X63_20695 [Geomonas sp. Red32]|uniref:hypothetical protein n=1 Tax=Geomonas sp. Red32 TaxID=2912856 RepID=UPI00202CB0CF|nr:hypothetical protein [Geomonas sp. Red32]
MRYRFSSPFGRLPITPGSTEAKLMVDWPWKKTPKVLEYRDNGQAFAQACSEGYLPLIGALIPALVEEDGGLGPDGERTFRIRVADSAGGKSVWSCTLKESRTFPLAGDFVGFRIVTIASDLPDEASLIGYIACKLQPVFVTGKGWRVAESYTPKNIKQDIHL